MNVNKRVLIAVPFLALLLFSGVASANPKIDFSSGILIDAQTIMIHGSGFGSSGPNVVVFDDFTGSVGEVVSLQATVGTWTNSASPVYVDDGNNTAVRLINAGAMKQISVNFVGVQEFFLSYKVKIPSGYHFPNTTDNGDFAPDSAWKMAWIMDDSTNNGYSGDDDICLPTWPNGTRFSLGGNDNAFPATAANGWVGVRVGQPETSTNWFSFDGWSRVTTYIKAGAIPETDHGIIWFSGLSEEFGHKLFEWTDRPVFDGDDNSNDNAVSQWTRLNLSGWNRTGGANSAYDSTTMAYYDDIYLATGANAAARVEIGNNDQYENCTNLAITTPNNWANEDISVTVRQGTFNSGEDVYLFVLDSQNNVSNGFGPFKFGSKMIIPPHVH